MSTKKKNDCDLFINAKQHPNNSSHFSNLNLNQNNDQCPGLSSVQSYSKSNFVNKDYHRTNIKLQQQFLKADNTFVDNNKQGESSSQLSWKKSLNVGCFKALKDLNLYDKQNFKKKHSMNDNNSSTLSLHIAAYENSNEASNVKDFENSNKKDKARNWKPKVQDPFEYPRQMEDSRSNKPEIMQFKASQKLLSLNQEMPSNTKIDRKKNGDDKIMDIEDTEDGEIKDELKEEAQEHSKRQSINSSKKYLRRKSEDEKERKSSKDEKDERPRKRRYTPHSISSDSDEEDNQRAKRIRRSEPSRRVPTETSSASRSKVERRHFYSRRSEPIPLPEVSLKKLVAGEYPIHEIPTKWNLSFEPEELTEIQPKKRIRPLIRMSSPQPITISSEAESSSSSPTKNVKVKSVVGNFWRVKPPFPRTKTIIAKDGTCLSLFFTDKYVFSNHFPADFTVNDINYSCSEQYYMRFKAVYFGDDEIARNIMQTSDPKVMKRYGRQVEGFDEEQWKKVSLQVMKIGCFHKFTQNKALRYELFRTIDTTLVEASPMDFYWGVGLSMDNEDIRNPRKWRGENLLGYILTRLRDHLKQQPEYQEEIKQVYTEFDPSVV